MKIRIFIVLLVVFLAFFSVISISASFIVGVSPGSLDIGKVNKDTTKLVNFFITTPSEEAILVKLEPEKIDLGEARKDLISNFSEEDTTSWVKIINNPVELKPANTTLKTTGGIIRGFREVSFLIEIPKNAEPGYHTISIRPQPITTQETIGTVGSVVVAITSFRVLLNVDGNPIRRGTILDVETGNYMGDRLEINTYFQNTGTNTISATGIQRIYNKNGTFITELYLGKEFVRPKEIKVFKGFLTTTGLSLGDYNAYTVIDYTTGKAERSSDITLRTSPPTALVSKTEGTSLIIIAIIIIVVFIISIIIYRRFR